MRLLTLVLVGVALLSAALAYYTFFAVREVHVAELVPGDFRFAVVYSSINDLEQLYEGRNRRRDFSPSRARVGDRMNVPQLDGFSYDAPVGYFVDREGVEFFLAPYAELGALEEAFDAARVNLNLRPPRRAARNYASLSEGPDAATVGEKNPLIAEAAKYPIALAGHPKTPADLRHMLRYLLIWDHQRKIQGVPQLSEEAGRLGAAVLSIVAEEADDLILALVQPGEERLAGRAKLIATASKGGILDRAALVAGKLELSEVLAGFPRDTSILAGAVLDGAGWKRLGLPLPLGDGAFAWGVVRKRYHPRRFNLLLIARPANAENVQALADAGPGAAFGSSGLEFRTVQEKQTPVRTAKLAVETPWLADLTRSSKREAPPIYVSTATENGTWLLAYGSQAEDIVRTSLRCLRGARELSIYGRQRAAYAGPITASSPLEPALGQVITAMAKADGMRAFRFPMPRFDIAGIGQPSAVTFTLDMVAGKAHGDLRMLR